MSGNSFGKQFVITTAGESHGPAMYVIIDGCPANLELSENDIQLKLDKRRPGQNALTTARSEQDLVNIESGVFLGKTTGTPIMLRIANKDARSEDYDSLAEVFRPSHADYVYQKKYGHRDHRGGGRASARETVARVAAGAIAQKFLSQKAGINFLAYVSQIGNIETDIEPAAVTSEQIENNFVRCPDFNKALAMESLIQELKQSGDSVGGIITCIINNVPIGLGEPVFDKLTADLAKAMLSINAARGFSIGEGFKAAAMYGSEHNDAMHIDDNQIKITSNHAGGIVGGISTGLPIIFQVAFKPVSTIKKMQNTVNMQHETVNIAISGRHDPCVLPRAVPIVEAMASLVIMDHWLRSRGSNG